MKSFIASFAVSLVLGLLIIRFRHLHLEFSGDHDLDGIQKFHHSPTPRVGGIAVFLGCLTGILVRILSDPSHTKLELDLMLSALPLFAAGLLEDTTKCVGIKTRLLAAALSTIIAGYMIGAWLYRLDIALLDSLITHPNLEINSGGICISGIFAIFLTVFAVSGVSNAFNLIDGYNGLAGVVGIIILLGIAYVAFEVHDHAILVFSLALIGAIAGFLVWNYPNGHIFLGDAGAYFIGFSIAESSVLLVSRNPEVSPWFPLLLSFYPIFETLFTIFRRGFINRSHPGMPDAAHLHQLIYRRLVRWAVGSSSTIHKTHRNAITAPYLWVFSSLAVIPAVTFWRNTGALILFTIAYGMLYVLTYRALILKKYPYWWVIRK